MPMDAMLADARTHALERLALIDANGLVTNLRVDILAPMTIGKAATDRHACSSRFL